MEHKLDMETTCRNHFCITCKHRNTNDCCDPCKTCIEDKDKCCYEPYGEK